MFQLVQIPEYLPSDGLTLKERKLLPLLDMHNRHLMKVGGGELPPGASAYLEPGVHYRYDTVSQTNPVDGSTVSKPVSFIGLEKVPMGDWDWADPMSHETEGGVTIKNLGDVYDRVERYTTDNPNSSWRMYLTPGGVRGWEMSQNMTPGKMFAATKYGELQDDTLQIDPFYQKLTSRKKYSPAHIDKTVPAAFYSRVSGKPLRKDDFVAFPLTTVGEGNINPYNERLVNTYHDGLIQKWMARESNNGTSAALDLLNRQISSLPNKYNEAIQKALELRRLI